MIELVTPCWVTTTWLDHAVPQREGTAQENGGLGRRLKSSGVLSRSNRRVKRLVVRIGVEPMMSGGNLQVRVITVVPRRGQHLRPSTVDLAVGHRV